MGKNSQKAERKGRRDREKGKGLWIIHSSEYLTNASCMPRPVQCFRNIALRCLEAAQSRQKRRAGVCAGTEQAGALGTQTERTPSWVVGGVAQR